MPVSWLNPAGGLRYHVRAWTSGDRWSGFRDALASWLAEFEPRSSRAVLVGPSAGYTFPDAFLKRFSSIRVLEPDPIAGFLLTRRLRRLGISELSLDSRDLLLSPLLEGKTGLAELLDADPGCALIFGNLLGQTSFLLGDEGFERFKSGFRERIWPRLEGRAWLSFHDRLSGNLAPSIEGRYRASQRLDDASVLSQLYPKNPGGAAVELFDHRSDGFFPDALPCSYFSWPIDRTRHHLIEAVASGPAGGIRRA
ncbi:MAG: hypothetical protein ABW061_06075 [Polyangiaceae bacterium]